MAEAIQKKEEKTADQTTVNSNKKKIDVMGMLLTGLFLANVGALGYFGVTLNSLFQRVKTLEIKKDSSEIRPIDKASSLGKEFEPKALGPLFRMDSFLVNIQSDQGTKFLQLQMELELKDEATKEEVLKNQAKLRDSVITLLSSRPYQQIRTAQGMKALRKDLLGLFNQNIAHGAIKDVFFTQFHFN